jgi:hypothetical protein
MGWRSLPGLEVYHVANVEYCAEPVRNIRLKFDDFISKFKNVIKLVAYLYHRSPLASIFFEKIHTVCNGLSTFTAPRFHPGLERPGVQLYEVVTLTIEDSQDILIHTG